MTLDESELLTELERTAEALSWNKAAYTSEVRFTDRVLKFHSKYWNELAEEPLPSVNTELLYNMVSGDIGDPGFLPLPAVRWGFPYRNLRVNVEHADVEELRAQLYLANEIESSGTVWFYRLEGSESYYQLNCDSGLTESGFFSGAELLLTIPGETACRLEVTAQ